MKITKTQLKEIIREELTTLNEKLINNPNQVLKGKTIESFKSNGYGKGYTMVFTDGTSVTIRAGGAGAQDTVYITKNNLEVSQNTEKAKDRSDIKGTEAYKRAEWQARYGSMKGFDKAYPQYSKKDTE
jgi:hypothetical protein